MIRNYLIKMDHNINDNFLSWKITYSKLIVKFPPQFKVSLQICSMYFMFYWFWLVIHLNTYFFIYIMNCHSVLKNTLSFIYLQLYSTYSLFILNKFVVSLLVIKYEISKLMKELRLIIFIQDLWLHLCCILNLIWKNNMRWCK